MKRKLKKDDLFVMVMLTTLDAPAWRTLSHGARSLYVALKRRHRRDINNNGSIFLSQRDAEAEIGSHTDYITRWFRELEHYGFIVMRRKGHFGGEGQGRAPHWRLTELPCGKDPPTRDFLRWNGTKFTDRKEKPCPANTGHPVPQIRDIDRPANTGHRERPTNTGHI